MSRISTVYSRMVTVLDSLMSSVSGYHKIPNVDTLENNVDVFLRKGYGLRYDGSSPTDGEFHTFVSDHNFAVVLTREFVKLESNVDSYHTSVRELLEDAYTVQKDFMNADQIGVESSVRLINRGPVSGLSDVVSGKKNFKSINVNFDIRISENI